jgi:hypothetical protein
MGRSSGSRENPGATPRCRRSGAVHGGRQRRVAIGAAGMLAWLTACGSGVADSSLDRRAPAAVRPVARQAPIDQELTRQRDAYQRAKNRAKSWLDALRVDPIELRAHGIKGKKKLVEQLDAYYSLWKVAAPADRGALLSRIKSIVSVTYEPRYHDMLSISDAWFKEDATSYLRAALLMDRLGLDTRLYRAEIVSIHARLNAHMQQRGPHQREVFHWYYRHFGLEEPFPLEAARRDGIIAQRRDPALLSDGAAYELTHEIYAPFEYGDKLDVDPFDEEARKYLQDALRRLTRRYLARGDLDLAAEFLECQHYLRMREEPTYGEAVTYLLQSQNPDGSWGSYPLQRAQLGDYVRQGYELHTTEVVIGALTAVFDTPMP